MGWLTVILSIMISAPPCWRHTVMLANCSVWNYIHQSKYAFCEWPQHKKLPNFPNLTQSLFTLTIPPTWRGVKALTSLHLLHSSVLRACLLVCFWLRFGKQTSYLRDCRGYWRKDFTTQLIVARPNNARTAQGDIRAGVLCSEGREGVLNCGGLDFRSKGGHNGSRCAGGARRMI